MSPRGELVCCILVIVSRASVRCVSCDPGRVRCVMLIAVISGSTLTATYRWLPCTINLVLTLLLFPAVVNQISYSLTYLFSLRKLRRKGPRQSYSIEQCATNVGRDNATGELKTVHVYVSCIY